MIVLVCHECKTDIYEVKDGPFTYGEIITASRLTPLRDGWPQPAAGDVATCPACGKSLGTGIYLSLVQEERHEPDTIGNR